MAPVGWAIAPVAVVGDAAGEPAGVADGPVVAGGAVVDGDGPPPHAARSEGGRKARDSQAAIDR